MLCRKKKNICAAVLVVFWVFATVVRAQEATLTDIIITNTRDDFLLYLKVDGAFTETIEKAVLSGVPTTFSFFIELQQHRKMWFDRTVADIKVTHTIKYDNLKKEFLVQRSWKNGKPETTQSLDEAKRLMTEIDSLKVVALSELEKGERYQLLAKAELSKLTLPLYLHYV